MPRFLRAVVIPRQLMPQSIRIPSPEDPTKLELPELPLAMVKNFAKIKPPENIISGAETAPLSEFF